MSHKFCPQCGITNRITARFCVQCGRAFGRLQAQGKFCPQCGTRRKPGTKFCAQCGLRWPVPLPLAAEPPIHQPSPQGVVLPPVADLDSDLPMLNEDEALFETQIDPMSRPDSLVRKGGKTGILLTEAELERLRQQPDRSVFIYTPKSNKRR